jgi:zinc protease
MKKLLFFFLAALVLPAQVKVPIEKYKLGNGMRVILSADRAVPVAAVYLIYDIGARAEEKGRTGFAHLFEHMMFQGSENAPKGMHFKAISSAGGLLNGSTHPDYTDYFQTMPANKLPLALWLEADRMRSLAITEGNLSNQKEAVKEERRMRLDNQPYALAIIEKWPELIFRNWQNQHSIIGSFEDLNAATVDDVSKFFKTYYAPNNAVLVIVGDINLPETKKLIETYFGSISPQPKPKHPDLREPPAKAVNAGPSRPPGTRSRRYCRLSRPCAKVSRVLRDGDARCHSDRRRQFPISAGTCQGQAIAASVRGQSWLALSGCHGLQGSRLLLDVPRAQAELHR